LKAICLMVEYSQGLSSLELSCQASWSLDAQGRGGVLKDDAPEDDQSRACWSPGDQDPVAAVRVFGLVVCRNPAGHHQADILVLAVFQTEVCLDRVGIPVLGGGRNQGGETEAVVPQGRGRDNQVDILVAAFQVCPVSWGCGARVLQELWAHVLQVRDQCSVCGGRGV